MSKSKVTDEWLYEIMPLIDEALIKDLEKDVDYEHEFSEGFEIEMGKLLTEKHMASKRKKKGFKINRIAASVAMMLLLALTAATSVYAYRNYLFSTIKTAWEDSVLYTYLFPENEDADIEFENITPVMIPRGYKKVDEIEWELLYSVTYEDDEGNQIIWDQQIVTESLSIVLDSEYQWTKDIPINGSTIEIWGYDDGHTVSYYENGDYVFTITADDISIEQIVNMIKK